MSTGEAEIDLIGPLLEGAKGVLASVAVPIVIAIGIGMLLVAKGWMGDTTKALIKVGFSLRAWRLGISLTMLIIGIGLLLHFGRYLLLVPTQAAIPVLAGVGLILGGIGWLSLGGRVRVRRAAFGLTCGVIVAIIAVTALGTVIGGIS